MNETKKAWFAPKRYGYGATLRAGRDGWRCSSSSSCSAWHLGLLAAPLSWICAVILFVGFIVLDLCEDERALALALGR